MLLTPKWLKKEKLSKRLPPAPCHAHTLILPDAFQVPSPNKKQRSLLKDSLLINRYAILLCGVLLF